MRSRKETEFPTIFPSHERNHLFDLGNQIQVWAYCWGRGPSLKTHWQVGQFGFRMLLPRVPGDVHPMQSHCSDSLSLTRRTDSAASCPCLPAIFATCPSRYRRPLRHGRQEGQVQQCPARPKPRRSSGHARDGPSPSRPMVGVLAFRATCSRPSSDPTAVPARGRCFQYVNRGSDPSLWTLGILGRPECGHALIQGPPTHSLGIRR
jgi:hypothetical protein